MKKLLTVWRQYSVFPDSFLNKAETSWISNNSSSSTASIEEVSASSHPTSFTSFTSFSSTSLSDPSSIATPWSFSTNSNPSPSFSFLPPPLIPSASAINNTVSGPLLQSNSSSSVLPISFAGLQIPLPSLPLPTPSSTIPLPIPVPASSHVPVPVPVPVPAPSTTLSIPPPPPPPSFLPPPSFATNFTMLEPPPPSSLLPIPPPLPFPLPPPSPSFETPNARKRTFEDMQPTSSIEEINWYTTPVYKESGDWVQIEGGCGPDEIKVLSRTLYIGGITKDMTQDMLREWFSPFGSVDSILINYSKFNCFLKLHNRRQAHAALQANLPQLKLNWGCGFGHKKFFHYGTGTSVLNLKALGANAAFLMTSPVGGIRSGCLRGGLTIEEPDVDFKVYKKWRDMS